MDFMLVRKSIMIFASFAPWREERFGVCFLSLDLSPGLGTHGWRPDCLAPGSTEFGRMMVNEETK
jgi:hypothetical protein